MITARPLDMNNPEDVREVLQARIIELEDALRSAQQLRPALLRQYGAVPECVLEFCNRARQVLK